MKTGCVFNIQRFSTDDGGGIRTCVFLKGCPPRCAWCHNAEGLSFAPELAFYRKNCIGCGSCVTVCSHGALSMQGKSVSIDRKKCVSCGKCADVCPSGALVKIGEYMTVDKVMEVVRRDFVFYGKTGGMTITGGEPLAQAAFTLALTKAAKAEKISVVVETSGFGKTEDLLALVPFCSRFLFDCKASGEQHEALIGVRDEVIVKNLDALCATGATVTLRCPIVPNVNLSEEFVQKIISLAGNNAAIKEIQLMPYHATGLEKSFVVGRSPQKRYETPSEELLTDLAKKIEDESGKHCFFEKN